MQNNLFILRTGLLFNLSLFISFNTSFSMEMEVERQKRERPEEVQEIRKKPKIQEEKKVVQNALYIVNKTEPDKNLFLVFGDVLTVEKFDNLDMFARVNIPFNSYFLVALDQIHNQETFSFLYHRNNKLAASRLTFPKNILQDKSGKISPGILTLETSSDGTMKISLGLFNPNSAQVDKINLNNYPDLKVLFGGSIKLENFNDALERLSFHGYL
jgi:hypothetical protein